MSGGHWGNNEAHDCPHSQTVDDDREGECICLLCGLVLEPLYQSQRNEGACFTERENDIQEIHNFLQDVGAHANIPQSLICYTEDYFRIIKKQLTGEKKKKFVDRDLASYALLETLCRHKVPRTVQEISYFTATETSKLFAVETALNIREVLGHPQEYSDRFCALLGLSFWDSKQIRGIVFNMFGLGNVRPQTVVALVVFLYCKEKKINIPLKLICEVCSVSSTNINKLARDVKEPYNSNISLLYT
jgi:transcription initiation factor TFIIIB Brf1 subunit/transcription initiation factor TFIIB